MAQKLPAFTGIRWISLTELGLSQLYLSQDKLTAISEWFTPDALVQHPLPVHDFGNGRYTLTDGHSRAFTAWRKGMYKVPVAYDLDEIITCAVGQMLYHEAIRWCERFHLYTVPDLAARIVSGPEYVRLWHERCDHSHALLTGTIAAQRVSWAAKHPELHLYGACEDLSILYFEDDRGQRFEFPNAE